jgi:hypothetical protein
MYKRGTIHVVGNVTWIDRHAFVTCPTCGKLKRKEAKGCKECQFAATRSPLNYDLIQINGENCRYLPLTQGLYSFVDESLYDEALVWNWHAIEGSNGIMYGVRHRMADERGSGRDLFLHQWIMGVSSAGQVDHINHNGLDNRRSNLRLCTHQQNMGNTRLKSCNTSGYKGVSRVSGSVKWMAKINDHGKQTYLGSSYDPVEAARLYDAAAKRVFGEFAWLNFPEGGK